MFLSSLNLFKFNTFIFFNTLIKSVIERNYSFALYNLNQFASIAQNSIFLGIAYDDILKRIKINFLKLILSNISQSSDQILIQNISQDIGLSEDECIELLIEANDLNLINGRINFVQKTWEKINEDQTKLIQNVQNLENLETRTIKKEVIDWGKCLLSNSK